MQKYTYIYWRNDNRCNDKDARRKTSLAKYIPLTLLQGFEKGYSRFACERELETEHNWNILTPKLMAVMLCHSCSPDAQPGVQRPTLLGDGFLYCILSASSLDPNSSGLPEGPFGRVWLSLPHFVLSFSNSTGTPTVTWLLSWLRYIIIQRPHDRPIDLWNWMFNRHQAEITVMQFTSHSLPVHQSMSVPWEFFSSSHFISQFLPTWFPLITATRMCHLLPVHHLEWHFGLGRRSKYNIPSWLFSVSDWLVAQEQIIQLQHMSRFRVASSLRLVVYKKWWV